MNTKISVYIPEADQLEMGEPLRRAVADLDLGVPYAEMMRYRIDGHAAPECQDVYYLCTDENDDLVSRLWMGWGKHDGAVGKADLDGVIQLRQLLRSETDIDHGADHVSDFPLMHAYPPLNP